jgi:hypothetical protein
MPMFQGILDHLNRKFDSDHIKETAESAKLFAPGSPLDAGFLVKPNIARKIFQAYLDKLPGSLKETLRGVIYYSLTSQPARPINFAWAPAYDSELTVWEFGCGITVLLKSRYPADAPPTRADGTG